MCFTFFFGQIAVVALTTLSTVTCGLVLCGPGVKKAKKSQAEMEYWLSERKRENEHHERVASRNHSHRSLHRPHDPARHGGSDEEKRESSDVHRRRHHRHHHHRHPDSQRVSNDVTPMTSGDERSIRSHRHIDAWRQSRPTSPDVASRAGSGRATPVRPSSPPTAADARGSSHVEFSGPSRSPRPQSVPTSKNHSGPATPTTLPSGETSETAVGSQPVPFKQHNDMMPSIDTTVAEAEILKEKLKDIHESRELQEPIVSSGASTL